MDWLKVWLPRETASTKNPVQSGIIGAFTDNLTHACKLYQMGIPVWLVRTNKDLVATCIDSAVKPLDCVGIQLPQRFTPPFIDISPAVPPHLVIYIGVPAMFRCYAAMGHYVQSFLLLNVLVVLSSSELVISSSQLVAQPHPKFKPAVGPAWIPQELRDLDSCSAQPVPLPLSKRQKLTDSSTIQTQSACNKFMEIQLTFIPSPLHCWDIAHEHLKKLWPFLKQPKLDCIVPDISMFFDTEQKL
ncbi:hypothetical protein BT96DRAFT_998952 [Gymnopus androsaceus JB14]|uniref:Uncharacterized protein n=1 Tax=Gymnopus androsaceus JB14 TaxID=1447944 RepID=A0A6A4H7B1_9AGAR|nr:hypothetical protein BT96DRAFT_998952 [Gymnopus androsaceus JB14]